MANKQLFQSAAQRSVPANSVNHAGAPAYRMAAKNALAQLAVTGCFGQTFYVSAGEQLDEVLQNAAQCEPRFVAQVAVYARRHGQMKDMPAVLLAHLATRGPEGLVELKRAFPLVIDNGRMLRNFVQVLRSGQLGRKSLGSAPKKLVQRWLAARSPMQLFRDSVGTSPSLVDVVKMVHPKPSSDEQRSMYGYLLGRDVDPALLPEDVAAFEAFKAEPGARTPPNVPSRMLQGLTLSKQDWKHIARQARWQETRMNLNSYLRHGVFDDPEMVELVASRLASEREVRGARAFPYQLLAAYRSVQANMPMPITEALQDAMEHALHNVPRLPGRVVVCTDVSGSMGMSVSGYRRGATSAVRCVDVAALFSVAVLRRNPSAQVIPFEHRVRSVDLNPRDSVMTLAQRLASVGGGGTNCSSALKAIEKQKVDLVVFVSDNESWVDANPSGWSHRQGTEMLRVWDGMRKRNPNAKLVCIDVTPNVHKQTVDREDILNIGGFSDAVFDVLVRFAGPEGRKNDFVRTIESVSLDA